MGAKVPGAQWQKSAFELALRLTELCGQMLQFVAAESEKVLAPQSTQVLSATARTVAEYLPPAHAVHAIEAAVAEYLPLAQSVHAALPAVSLYIP